MNNHKLSYYDLEAVISELLDSGVLTTEDDLEDEFREVLRETPIEFTIAGVNFTPDPADYLEENDPTAFRTGFNDWLDCEGYEEITLNGTLYLTNDIYSVEEAIDAKVDELEDELEEDEDPEEEEDEDEN
jgi:hypothetical protein